MCAGVRTLQMEIGLRGNVGDERLGGRVVAGFERPSSMRLEGVGPFGRVGFILAARAGTAVLVLPRESSILRNAPPEAILEALTGVALGPADLQAVFTGCVLPGPKPVSGLLRAGGWATIEIEADPEQGTAARRTATLYLQRSGSLWQLRVARRDHWRVDYRAWSSSFPQSVQLSSTNPRLRVNLTAELSQLETNTPIVPEAFTVEEREDMTPITIEDLRQAGPLRGQ